MNKALTIQSDAVQKYQGMVDKYIGDAMMAIFNAPIDLLHHEQIAVECAKEIQENIIKADIGVEIGVGVNTGEAVIGNMGSDTGLIISAIGDAVNTAARLESATKEAGVNILIGEETEKYCGVYVKTIKTYKSKR
jgi:adenylate cyclase